MLGDLKLVNFHAKTSSSRFHVTFANNLLHDYGGSARGAAGLICHQKSVFFMRCSCVQLTDP